MSGENDLIITKHLRDKLLGNNDMRLLRTRLDISLLLLDPTEPPTETT